MIVAREGRGLPGTRGGAHEQEGASWSRSLGTRWSSLEGGVRSGTPPEGRGPGKARKAWQPDSGSGYEGEDLLVCPGSSTRARREGAPTPRALPEEPHLGGIQALWAHSGVRGNVEFPGRGQAPHKAKASLTARRRTHRTPAGTCSV